MLPLPTESRLVRFATFDVDLKAGEIRRDGQCIRLQEQPLLVLKMLVEHAGDIVTREELHGCLWPDDTFVDFDQGLNKAINKIRRALGDCAEHPHIIQTLPKRGYRLVALLHNQGENAPFSNPTASEKQSWRATIFNPSWRRLFANWSATTLRTLSALFNLGKSVSD